jgi:hypothetical protein
MTNNERLRNEIEEARQTCAMLLGVNPQGKSLDTLVRMLGARANARAMASDMPVKQPNTDEPY